MNPPSCIRAFSHMSLDMVARSSIASRSFLLTPQASCFSTSAARHSNPNAKKKTLSAAPKRGTRTLNIKKGRKKAGEAVAKRLSPDEQRAMRKRIVLSNNNALEVAGLKDLSKDDVLSEANHGLVMGIPEDAVDAMRAVEAFKPRQGWSMFRRPATLMRTETIQLAQLLQEVENSGNDQAKKTLRRLLVGDRMSGKSTLLLQGLTMAFLRDWTIINLPNAWDIVNAHTEYGPLPDSHPTQYTQNTYTAGILSQTLKANSRLFRATKVTTNPTLSVPLRADATLEQLVGVGVSDPELSWPVFMALWKELTLPGRPPIMLAIDGVSHIMRESEYFSADMNVIHAHDLAIVRHFVDLLSAKTTLPNGGIVLAATSSSNVPTNPAVDFSIQLAEARQLDPNNKPIWNPYKNIDQRVMDTLHNIEILKLRGLSKEEARSIIEYYAESGMVRARIDEGFISDKWSLSGMGNIGELERATVKFRV